MKLDYLHEGSSECPLLRLHDFTPAEAQQLYRVLRSLATGKLTESPIHALPFVEAVACQLTCRIASSVPRLRHADADSWEWSATQATWRQVAGLVAPFARGASGFQWLNADGHPDDPAVLISADGHW